MSLITPFDFDKPGTTFPDYEYYPGDEIGMRVVARSTDPDSTVRYQWQVDTGAGFTNIADADGILRGAETPTYLTERLEGVYTGRKYRCKVEEFDGVSVTDTEYSATITLTKMTVPAEQYIFDQIETGRSGWREPYWERAAVPGEVAQFGHLIEDLLVALDEKYYALYQFYNSGSGVSWQPKQSGSATGSDPATLVLVDGGKYRKFQGVFSYLSLFDYQNSYYYSNFGPASYFPYPLWNYDLFYVGPERGDTGYWRNYPSNVRGGSHPIYAHYPGGLQAAACSMAMRFFDPADYESALATSRTSSQKTMPTVIDISKLWSYGLNSVTATEPAGRPCTVEVTVTDATPYRKEGKEYSAKLKIQKAELAAREMDRINNLIVAVIDGDKRCKALFGWQPYYSVSSEFSDEGTYYQAYLSVSPRTYGTYDMSRIGGEMSRDDTVLSEQELVAGVTTPLQWTFFTEYDLGIMPDNPGRFSPTDPPTVVPVPADHNLITGNIIFKEHFDNTRNVLEKMYALSTLWYNFPSGLPFKRSITGFTGWVRDEIPLSRYMGLHVNNWWGDNGFGNPSYRRIGTGASIAFSGWPEGFAIHETCSDDDVFTASFTCSYVLGFDDACVDATTYPIYPYGSWVWGNQVVASVDYTEVTATAKFGALSLSLEGGRDTSARERRTSGKFHLWWGPIPYDGSNTPYSAGNFPFNTPTPGSGDWNYTPSTGRVVPRNLSDVFPTGFNPWPDQQDYMCGVSPYLPDFDLTMPGNLEVQPLDYIGDPFDYAARFDYYELKVTRLGGYGQNSLSIKRENDVSFWAADGVYRNTPHAYGAWDMDNCYQLTGVTDDPAGWRPGNWNLSANFHYSTAKGGLGTAVSMRMCEEP